MTHTPPRRVPLAMVKAMIHPILHTYHQSHDGPRSAFVPRVAALRPARLKLVVKPPRHPNRA